MIDILNFKNEYYLLEKGRVLYPTAFTNLDTIEIYGSKEGGITGTEDTAHVFKIPNNYYSLNAGNIDFSRYPNGIENDFKSIKIVNIESLISLGINFNEWKDITPDNLKITFEQLGNSVKEVQKRLSEVGLYIDSNLPGEIGLPKLPVGCTWYCNQDGHITAIPISDLYAKFNQLLINLHNEIKNIFLNNTMPELIEQLKKENDKLLDMLASSANNLKPKQVPDIEFLKRVNAKVDEVYEVLGYYKFNDGVVHKRVISTTDDGSGVQLNNGLWANLIKEQSAPLFYETFLNKTRGFVAHRGLSQIAPENTLPAYQKAYDNNITIWETDLEITKDGYWVLMHDDTVDRTTNGTGRVDSLTLEQIKQLNIDGGANATTIYDGTKVPTFEEWLALAKKLNCYPFVELKRLGATEEEVKSIVDIVKKYNMEERTAFISFGSDVLEKVRKFSFKIQLWWIADDIDQSTINWCKKVGNAHLDPYWEYVSKEKILLANSQGVNIAVWTVNNVEYAHKLFDMGVSLVTGDWISEVH